MAGRKFPDEWWHEITRSERFNRAEWLMLGVSALALAGVALVLARALQ